MNTDKRWKIDEGRLRLADIASFALTDGPATITISERCESRVRSSHARLLDLLERRVPVYGVNTGFGDSCFRSIAAEKGEQLQKNLISYLLCGVGEPLPRAAVRAMCLFRLHSITRGYSGVSWDLVQAVKNFLERDWLPRVPSQGSLGASGDLIPLAYLAGVLQGEGVIDTPDGPRDAAALLKEHGVAPYRLKAKEGLALVNGTSTMAGLALQNYRDARYLIELATLGTTWVCLALGGRPEAFSSLVNEIAKSHPGQACIASWIREELIREGHSVIPVDQITVADGKTISLIQDKYSLRCAPQVLGPVLETLELAERWLETEINGVSDNPLIGEDGNLAMGGNFYGGYLGQGLDYLKLSLGHVADLVDRQLLTVIDEKSNRGLPPNLANWPGVAAEDRFLHHGLKGLHQAVNAITAEILSMTPPNGAFSRSSESHNQDKVSLGTTSATHCARLIDSLYSVMALHLVCLAQALDLRGIRLQGAGRKVYEGVRAAVPFVEYDRPLDNAIENLKKRLREEAMVQTGGIFS